MNANRNNPGGNLEEGLGARRSRPLIETAEAETPARGLVSTLVGWVLLPLLVAATIFAVGVHLGANQPDAWFTELVRWLSSL
ncbi:MAG: hypothetical protein OEZ06_07190 [Myxococcales bacterium]|nr:hypothetical protein [Myxococcales bacterium]